MTQPLTPPMSSAITASYTIVKPRIFGVFLIPNFPMGESRSIPAQVGTPIVFPPVSPSVGKEHPHEGSITIKEDKPSMMVKNDPTLEREHPAVS